MQYQYKLSKSDLLSYFIIITMDLNDIYQSPYTLKSDFQLKMLTESYSKSQITANLQIILRKIAPLKKYALLINQQFQQLKKNFLIEVAQSMRKIISFHNHTCQQKSKLIQELQQSKHSQKKMKEQVFQLREMINQFLIDNSKQLKKKDLYICQLQKCLKFNGILIPQIYQQKNCQQQQRSCYQQANLTAIQEVSQYETSNQSSKLETMRQLSESIFATQENQSEPTNKKIRNFINNFRKNIGESQSNQKITSIAITNQTKPNSIGSSNVNNSNAVKFKQSISSSGQTSLQSSSIEYSFNELSILGDSTKINEPLKNESPKHISFLRKKSKNSENQQNVCMTEGNQQISKEKYSIHDSIFRKTHQRNNSGEKQRESLKRYSSRQSSRNSSASKEKIKVTTKIVEQYNTIQKKRPQKKLGSVRLGGKHYISKIRTTIKQAFTQYRLWEGASIYQIKYEGQTKQNYRDGFGRLYYQNGFVYEGFFKKNYRHGKGQLLYKDKIICEGIWQYGQLNGNVYMDLGYLSQSCPQALKESIFKGNMQKNLFQGPCDIIFPCLKQKIVTKFHLGIPIGQFTLYAQHNIDFGFWPQ